METILFKNTSITVKEITLEEHLNRKEILANLSREFEKERLEKLAQLNVEIAVVEESDVFKQYKAVVEELNTADSKVTSITMEIVGKRANIKKFLYDNLVINGKVNEFYEFDKLKEVFDIQAVNNFNYCEAKEGTTIELSNKEETVIEFRDMLVEIEKSQSNTKNKTLLLTDISPESITNDTLIALSKMVTTDNNLDLILHLNDDNLEGEPLEYIDVSERRKYGK